MLREDTFDIDMTELDTFVPGRVGVPPIRLKAKTSKTL
jgi:hypothetical protein